MGFFSSRKSSDDDNVIASTSTAAPPPQEKGVVQVIRSRFYGRQKGKERELPASFTAHGGTAAATLAGPIPQPQPTTLLLQPAQVKNKVTLPAASSAGPSKPRSYHDLRIRPSSPTKGRGLLQNTTKSLPASPIHTRGDSSSLSNNMGRPSSPVSRRKQTDNVTVTLAQRLNELATANAEGLLTDDEYRLLRQNLFERFSTNTTVPTENPVVPVVRARPRQAGSSSLSRPASGIISNFQVEVKTSRPPSVQSKSSLTSGVTSLLRRATGRRTASGSKDFSDTSSVVSNQSSSSKLFRLPRALTKKSSDASVHTVASRQADAASISSRRTGMGSSSDHMSHFSHSGSRSITGSIRKQANPPSSFRAIGIDSRFAGSNSNVFDDDHLQTSQEIQAEITAVQAEANRLMDAFHGLELTTMNKNQRRPRLGIPFPAEEGAEASWPNTPDGHSQKRVLVGDSDTMSMKSVTSTGTSPSMARSAYSGRRVGVVRGKSINTSLALNNSRPGSIHRKGSFSSVASQERRGLKGSAAPPVPALPSAYGHLSASNASSVSLARSTGQGYMTAVPEDDSTAVVGPAVDSEVEDIRRRRDEVQSRYEARLEYLRAKLKGAQLHEKLVKK